jgi:hypothetical protein
VSPAFFIRANRLAPKKKGATSLGTSFMAMVFTRRVMAPKAAAPLPFAFFRCSSLRPEGPALVPAFKPLMALYTSSDTRVKGEARVLLLWRLSHLHLGVFLLHLLPVGR